MKSLSGLVTLVALVGAYSVRPGSLQGPAKYDFDADGIIYAQLSNAGNLVVLNNVLNIDNPTQTDTALGGIDDGTVNFADLPAPAQNYATSLLSGASVVKGRASRPVALSWSSFEHRSMRCLESSSSGSMCCRAGRIQRLISCFFRDNSGSAP